MTHKSPEEISAAKSKANDPTTHLDCPLTDADKQKADRLAGVIGDLFIDDAISPRTQWEQVVRALRVHGLQVTEIDAPDVKGASNIPQMTPELKAKFDELIGSDHMAYVPCLLDGKPSAALCATNVRRDANTVFLTPLFVPVTSHMLIELPGELPLDPDTPAVGVMPNVPKPPFVSSMMSFTPELAAKLQKGYASAVANDRKSFLFEGQEMVTSYAKYVLEYLKLKGVVS